MVRGPNWLLTPLKSASQIRILSFVPPSKIFVWGAYNSLQWIPILPIPNEDLGRRNKRWHPDFEGSTFQVREYSIWATRHWKVNRKSGCHLLFLLPKSSFGKHAIVQTITFSVVFIPQSLLLLRSPFLIYDFHATFDRGLKVRLFGSPQWDSTPPKRRFWHLTSTVFQALFKGTRSENSIWATNRWKVLPGVNAFGNVVWEHQSRYLVAYACKKWPRRIENMTFMLFNIL